MTPATDGPQHQLAWVFDLNRCIGCQTCSVACKVLWTQGEGADPMWWCSVGTQPGRGTPRDYEQMGGGYDASGKLRIGRLPTDEEYGGAWQFNFDDVYSSGKRQQEFLHPTGAPPTWGMNWDEDQGAGQYPNAYFFYLPRICNHCTKPSCLEACPHGAIYKRAEDGLVLRDEDRCCGAKQCVRACPYKKIYFNPVRGVSQHCIGCFPRIEKGVAPACVRQCAGRAAFVGFIDDANSAVHKLVRRWNLALPLHAEWNTAPNVFYIPPLSPPRIRPDGSLDESERRIPLDYLESLFGAGVHGALQTLEGEMSKRRRGEPSEIATTLIAYEWKEMLGPLTRDPAEITWK
ncbi:MAG: 4Fe-4S dicluster domain-containing protein [Deltaproteobacteria bacterium]|nr:4Fe-4S dicluster domain-containing protein [Deltaproteobacteria bacterium]